MENLDYKILKTFVRCENHEEYKVIQLLALSNKQFDIDIFNVHLDEYQSFGEGIHRFEWVCDNEPDHSVRFDDFLSADKHIELIASGLYESKNHDPSDAVTEMLNKESDAEFQASMDFRKKQLEEKQAEHDKEPKYEATCRQTGERMVFAADTEEKALKLAEMYFPGGVLRIERVRTKVKADGWDY